MDFKVKCIKVKKYPEYFTVGKIYDVKDNKVICDNGFVGDAWSYFMNGNADFEAFSRWWSDWFDFELVEEDNTMSYEYKIGDHVVCEESNVSSWNYKGKTGVIGRIDLSYEFPYRIDMDDGSDPSWCTVSGLVEENNNIVEEDNTMFTKNDLKTGMFGVMSNRQGYFVVVDDKIVYKDGGYDFIREMNDDMDFDYWKIEKVYTGCPSFDSLHGRINRGDTDGLVYDRERDTEPLYNGKIICVDNCHNENNYTIGKIYEFKGGVMTCDNGHIFGKNHPFHSFDDWAEYSSAKFLEIVE